MGDKPDPRNVVWTHTTGETIYSTRTSELNNMRPVQASIETELLE